MADPQLKYYDFEGDLDASDSNNQPRYGNGQPSYGNNNQPSYGNSQPRGPIQ